MERVRKRDLFSNADNPHLNPAKGLIDKIGSKLNQDRQSREEDFTKEQKLGAGSFGEVYLVRR